MPQETRAYPHISSPDFPGGRAAGSDSSSIVGQFVRFCSQQVYNMKRNVRLHLESLEDRQVPATFGIPWSDPQHLTVSFVRDGTDIGGTPSTLFQTMQTLSPSGAWQRDILRAIQTWSNVANL